MMDSTFERHLAMLRTALGQEIQQLIDDDSITEVYINSDYIVRVDSSSGRRKTDITLSPETVKRICEIVAGMNDQIINEDHPMLGVEIQPLKIRVQIEYPPCSPRPTFFFRKKPRKIFTLEDYIKQGALSLHYYNAICDCIKQSRNVIVCGATGSGKTTFLNAILKKLSELNPDHRLCILEDLPELQCSSDDVQYLTTSGNKVTSITMQDLVFACMRLSPTRIIIGEVRDLSAYDVLKAWNTGHPGGFCTIHADGCEDCLTRLELLIKEAVSSNNSTSDIQRLIGSTIGNIISIQKKACDGKSFRLVDDMISIERFDLQKNCYLFSKV